MQALGTRIRSFAATASCRQKAALPLACFQAGRALGHPNSARFQPARATESSSGVTTGKGDYRWSFSDTGKHKPGQKGGRGRIIQQLPVSSIIRPFGGTRENNSQKVEALMVSIEEIGLQEPIDVLEVNGKYYGFSGCHRFEAHQRLGKETILCRVRKANDSVLRAHLA